MSQLRTRRRRPTDLTYNNGRTASWEAIRQHVLKLEPTCQLCGAPSVEVDHIWPIHFGGDDRRSNLQGLCVACNRSKGNAVDDDDGLVHWEFLEAAVHATVSRAIVEADDVDRFLGALTKRAIAYAGLRDEDQWDAWPCVLALQEQSTYLHIAADAFAAAVHCTDEIVADALDYKERTEVNELLAGVSP